MGGRVQRRVCGWQRGQPRGSPLCAPFSRRVDLRKTRLNPVSLHTSDDADDDWPTTADGYVLHDQIGKGATATVSVGGGQRRGAPAFETRCFYF